MSTIINGTSSAITFPDSTVQNSAGLASGGTIANGTVTTLTSTTLSDGTNSTSSTNCIQGSAKAWVNFNGTSIRASYNVSSVTVNAGSDFTVNFTNAFSDANYSMAGMGGAYATQLACVIQPFSSYPPTTSACRVQTVYVNGTGINITTLSIAFFR